MHPDRIVGRLVAEFDIMAVCLALSSHTVELGDKTAARSVGEAAHDRCGDL
jgi:hypothetical protein